MTRIIKTSEMDRPTYNSLSYLTKVHPHFIHRENFIVDEYVKHTLEQRLGVDTVAAYGDYTRSQYTLEGHYKNLWLYDIPIVRRPSHPYLKFAIEETAKAFKFDTPVYSIPWTDLRSVPFIPSSSAGWGYIGPKGAPGNLGKAIRRAVYSLETWRQERQHAFKTFKYSPDLAWTRTQMGTFDNPKVRNVWGTAFENILIEGINAYPLIGEYTKGDYPIVTGINYYKRLPSLINRMLYDGKNRYIGVGLDIKSFDASIQPWLIRESFDILKQNIIFPSQDEEDAWNYAEEFFIKRPIVMPDGRMWLKRLGIPSGSSFTQLIGSVANHIGVTFAQLCVHGQPYKTYVLGDDSAFGVPDSEPYPDTEDYRDPLSYLGLKLHPTKGMISSDPRTFEFLGHSAHNARVYRPLDDLIRLALYPEHPVAGPTESLVRIKGLLLDTALQHTELIKLHDDMEANLRHRIDYEADFSAEDRHFYTSVVRLGTKPMKLTINKIFTLT